MRMDLKVFTQFLKAQSFLNNYTPADMVVTSEKEIKIVKEVLNLESMGVEELNMMRDFIVLYYEHVRKGIPREDSRWFKYLNGMMSVTTVIDLVIDKKEK